MKAIIGSVVLCMGLSSASAEAQAVYKCVVAGEVTYQQSPCEAPPPLVPRPGAAPVNALLLGTWRSDHDLTMNFMRKHTTLSKKQDDFLDQITGFMTITFTADRIKSVLPAQDIKIDGKPLHFPGTHDDSHYSVVALKPNLVSISSVDSTTGEPIVADYNFEGHDTLWVRMDAQGKTALDPRSREYFRRVK